MKTHIVLAHPETKSFNGHLSDISQEILCAGGWEHTLSNLYAMDFDPREGPHHYRNRANPDVFHAQTEQRFNADNESTPSEVREEIQRLLDCDLLVLHFPLWWFGMPAILKGWMDRVFVYGRMYRSVMRYDTGICSGKKTGANEESCSPSGREGDTRLHLWPILFSFRYLGFDVLEPEIFHGVGGVAFIEGHENGFSTLDVYSNRWVAVLKNSLPDRWSSTTVTTTSTKRKGYFLTLLFNRRSFGTSQMQSRGSLLSCESAHKARPRHAVQTVGGEPHNGSSNASHQWT